MKKHARKDNQNLLYGWEYIGSINVNPTKEWDIPIGPTIAIPVTEPRTRDRKDPAGLWNPPMTEQ